MHGNNDIMFNIKMIRDFKRDSLIIMRCSVTPAAVSSIGRRSLGRIGTCVVNKL